MNKDIVLLHGWGFHSGIYTNLAKELSKNFRVTLIDFPGFGKSKPCSDKLNLEKLVELILEIAPKKSTYLGWSFGGLVASQLAYTHPDRINKLINLCSSPKFITDTDWPGIPADELDKLFADLSKNHHSTLKRFLLAQILHKDFHKISLLEINNLLRTNEKTTLPTLINYLNLLKFTDLRQIITRIACPTHYIFGDLDKLVPATAAPKITLLQPKVKISIIQDCSHLAFITHSSKIVNLINEFINE